MSFVPFETVRYSNSTMCSGSEQSGDPSGAAVIPTTMSNGADAYDIDLAKLRLKGIRKKSHDRLRCALANA